MVKLGKNSIYISYYSDVYPMKFLVDVILEITGKLGFNSVVLILHLESCLRYVW